LFCMGRSRSGVVPLLYLRLPRLSEPPGEALCNLGWPRLVCCCDGCPRAGLNHLRWPRMAYGGLQKSGTALGARRPLFPTVVPSNSTIWWPAEISSTLSNSRLPRLQGRTSSSAKLSAAKPICLERSTTAFLRMSFPSGILEKNKPAVQPAPPGNEPPHPRAPRNTPQRFLIHAA